jgi:TorA maturation chaperone TorD
MDEQKELFRVRLRFLDLGKSFFQGEPDAEKISRWRGTFSALAVEQISPSFDQVVREFADRLNTISLSELQDEYHTLFIDPFEGSLVNTTASYYLDGRNFGPSLVEIKGLFHEAGIKKDEAVTEPEDSLVILLDTFTTLVEEEQKGGEKGETAKRMQGRLLKEFLLPFLEKFCLALGKNEQADFFCISCRFLREYFVLERGLTADG